MVEIQASTITESIEGESIMKNYAREGKIAERLADGGCRETEIETYLLADRDGSRPLDLDAITTAWIEAEKQDEATAHRWLGGASADEKLFLAAFVGVDGVGPSLKAQGAIVTRYGEKFAHETAARYGAKLASTKPGKNPNASADDEKPDTKGHKNPWSPNYKGGDAQGERVRIIKTMGTKAAAGMATAAGSDLAGRPLKGRAA